MFRRWYKDSQNDQLHGHEQTDSEYSYHRRTIPPIPGLNNGMSTAPENQPYPPVELKEVDYISERESEKEEEEEDEDLKHDLGEMFSSEVGTDDAQTEINLHFVAGATPVTAKNTTSRDNSVLLATSTLHIQPCISSIIVG